MFVALFVIVGAAVGIGTPSVPDGAIAVVEEAPDGTITQEEFDRALVQAAARQGLKDVPADGRPPVPTARRLREGDLILSRWVLGEADERGIEITERQIDDELASIKQQQFGSEKAFQKFLDQSGFTLEEARQRIQLQLASDAIQKAVLPSDPTVTDEEVQTYYDANAAQFEQPETRDVRVILTKTEAEANQALQALGSRPVAEDLGRGREEVLDRRGHQVHRRPADRGRGGSVRAGARRADVQRDRERDRRPVPGRRRLLRDRGREGDPGGHPAARRPSPGGHGRPGADGCRPDPRQPGRQPPAADRAGLPGRLPDEVDRAHFLRRGLSDRPLLERRARSGPVHQGHRREPGLRRAGALDQADRPGLQRVFGTPAAVGLAQGPQHRIDRARRRRDPGPGPRCRAAPAPRAQLRRRHLQTAPQTAPPGG